MDMWLTDALPLRNSIVEAEGLIVCLCWGLGLLGRIRDQALSTGLEVSLELKGGNIRLILSSGIYCLM